MKTPMDKTPPPPGKPPKRRVLVETEGFEDGGRTIGSLLPALAADFTARFEALRGADVAVRWKNVPDKAAEVRARRTARAFQMLEGTVDVPPGWRGPDVERVAVFRGCAPQENPPAQGALALEVEPPPSRAVPIGAFRGFSAPADGGAPSAEAWKTRTWLRDFEPEILRWSLACRFSSGKRGFLLDPPGGLDPVQEELREIVGTRLFDALQILSLPRFRNKLGRLGDDAPSLLSAVRAHESAIAGAYRSGRFAAVAAEARRIERERARFDKILRKHLADGDTEGARSLLCAQLNAERVLAVFLAPILPRLGNWTAQAFGDRPLDWNSIQAPRETGKVKFVFPDDAERIWSGLYGEVSF